MRITRCAAALAVFGLAARRLRQRGRQRRPPTARKNTAAVNTAAKFDEGTTMAKLNEAGKVTSAPSSTSRCSG